jgi:hypothetical protein
MEQNIQNKLVMWFSQEYPQHYGRLFMVNNNTTSKENGTKLKAMGIIAGVSDLLFIGNGYFAAIEIKAPNTRHKTSHVLQQMEFIKTMIFKGHRGIISSDLNILKLYLSLLIQNDENYADDLSYNELQKITMQIDKGVKSIKF